MDFLKKFFGLSSNNQQFNNSYQNSDDDEDILNRRPQQPYGNDQTRGFHIFSDPLQMHQYFEHQMNEMLRMFGFQGFGNEFFSEHFSLPTLEEEKPEGSPEEHLRNQFLKNGYENPPVQKFEKVDKDIDGKMNLGDLDSVFGSQSPSRSLKPNTHNFFGQSKSIKTIRNGDGSVETHRVVRDNDGNEEVTICRKMEDKEYCIIKKKDKYGKEEVIENLVNLDENEKDSFFKAIKSTPKVEDKVNNNFPFDMFFK